MDGSHILLPSWSTVSGTGILLSKDLSSLLLEVAAAGKFLMIHSLNNNNNNSNKLEFYLLNTLMHIYMRLGRDNSSSVLSWRIPKDRGAWWATIHGVARSQTWLRDSAQHRDSTDCPVFKNACFHCWWHRFDACGVRCLCLRSHMPWLMHPKITN